MDSLPEFKTCTKCLMDKPINAFGIYKASKDGLRNNCKSCRNSKEAEYRASNWEDIYKRKQESRNRNIERSRESARRHYYKAKDMYLSKHKERYELDKEFRELKRARNKKWRKNNPELNARKTMRRYAAKKKVLTAPYTVEQVVALWGICCHMCGDLIDFDAPRNCKGDGWELGLHLDHVIPITAGGSDSLDNVKPAHALCNIKKGTKHI